MNAGGDVELSHEELTGIADALERCADEIA
jgi:hypothetical protein